MKFGLLVGIGVAFLVHAGVIAFGGLLFAGAQNDQGKTQQVELLSADDSVEAEKKKDEPEPENHDESEVIVDEEPPPDAAEMMRNLELTPLSATPALDASSLSEIEAALSGQSGLGGDFAQSVDFASGGRISGTGKAGAMGGGDDAVFSIAEIDQPPRATLQGAPMYPATMRGKKVEGVVTLLFIVDASGKVTSPRVESSTHANFEAPALDAVKKWKFEPALRAGQRVPCRMRIPIRFPAN
jgi:TonB family protein